MPNDTPPLQKPATLSRLLSEFFLTNKINCLFIFFSSIFLTLPALMLPALSKVVINRYLILHDYTLIELIIVLAIIALILQISLTYLQGITSKKTEIKIAFSFNVKFITHLIKLPLSFFAHEPVGDLISRLQSNDALAGILGGQLIPNIVSFIQCTIFMVAIAFYSPILIFIPLSSIAINIIGYELIKNKRKKANSKLLLQKGLFYANIIDTYREINVLKASGAEYYIQRHCNSIVNSIINLRSTIESINAYMNSIPITISSLSSASILIFGSLLVIKGQLTIGDLVALQALIVLFNRPIRILMNFSSNIQQLESEFARCTQITDIPLMSEESNSHTLQKKSFNIISIKNLSFTNEVTKNKTIDNVNLEIPCGSKIGFAGNNQSGLTDLCKLIIRWEQLQDGEIYLNNQLINEMNTEKISDHIGHVGKENSLFSGSIIDNITLWSNCIGIEKINEVLRAANIYDLVYSNAAGLNYKVVGGGLNLSYGERQCICIARTFLKNPPIILLDNSFSSIDGLTAIKIIDHLLTLPSTVIVISNEPHILSRLDSVYFFDKGKIASHGPYQQLIKSDSSFCSLTGANPTTNS